MTPDDATPHPVAIIEWRTATAYERMGATDDARVYLRHDASGQTHELVASEMALYWYLMYHARVSE